jgi:hypothetical protein
MKRWMLIMMTAFIVVGCTTNTNGVWLKENALVTPQARDADINSCRAAGEEFEACMKSKGYYYSHEVR